MALEDAHCWWWQPPRRGRRHCRARAWRTRITLNGDLLSCGLHYLWPPVDPSSSLRRPHQASTACHTVNNLAQILLFYLCGSAMHRLLRSLFPLLESYVLGFTCGHNGQAGGGYSTGDRRPPLRLVPVTGPLIHAGVWPLGAGPSASGLCASALKPLPTYPQ
jgi:hypothetical protein